MSVRANERERKSVFQSHLKSLKFARAKTASAEKRLIAGARGSFEGLYTTN